MPSQLPGYAYDIFISYRQNDNRSGWVTEFVKALQEELAATIKESVSVYFDSNPLDGLLETHNVDKSLEGKLKCLIFIPILSQTYCDPKSFAWQNEFCAFNKMAAEDTLGRDIILGNGNVASRILPVKVHDLDAEDKSRFETELGGALRAVEFSYREAGVNRPLSSTDSRAANQNKTDYRNQVNKVANAVKLLLQAINQQNSSVPVASDKASIVYPPNSSRKRGILVFFLIALLAAAGYYFYPKSLPSEGTSAKKSLAVLPFVDLSPQKDQEWFSDGLTEELLNSLAQLQELDLIARTSSFAFKGKNIPVNRIADSLHVDYIVEGSVRRAGSQLRITAQLIQADKGTHLWSNTYDRSLDDVFAIQEDIAGSIAQSLNILLDDEKKTRMFSSGTRNVEAYEEYLMGSALYELAHTTGPIDSLLFQANVHFEKAIARDPDFAAPYVRHKDFYSHYFVHGIDVHKFITGHQTDELLNRKIMEDLDAAISLEKNPLYVLNSQAERAIHSSDWTQFPGIVRQLKNLHDEGKAVVVDGFCSGLVALSNPELLAEISSERLRRDPLNSISNTYFAFALVQLNLMDSAMRVIERSKNSFFSWILYFKQGKYAEALGQIERADPKLFGAYYLVCRLLAGKYEGTQQDLIREIRSMGLEATMIYNALGRYESADSTARVYDLKLQGSLRMTDFLQFSPLCFHLSSTPVFSARLREAGIDPVKYEKEHYYRFPVVKLK